MTPTELATALAALRHESLTPAKRKAIASKAAKARWAKTTKKQRRAALAPANRARRNKGVNDD